MAARLPDSSGETKVGNPSVSIPNGGTVAAGMQVILTDVSIHATLGYQLDDNQVIMNVRDAIEIVLSAEAMKPLKLVLERKR